MSIRTGERLDATPAEMSATFPSVPRTMADVLPTPSTRAMGVVRDAALVIGFAAFTALLAQVRITLGFTPVPITGQTLGALLAGATLGWRRGALSMSAYWLLGIVMPVAWYADDTTGTSVREGWNAATGTTAGYLFGFVVAAAAVGYLAERKQDRQLATSIPAMLAGTAAIYTCGVIWLAHDLGIPVATGDENAIELGLTPFVIGDAIKLLVAGAAAPTVWVLLRSRTENR